MTRDEILEKLHNISSAAELTYMPSEFAIECSCVSSKGTSYEWRGLYDWPFYKVKVVDSEVYETIKGKMVKEGFLDPDDIKNTDLEFILKILESKEATVDLITVFGDLKHLHDFKNYLYVICDPEKHVYHLYNSFQSLSDAFASFYACDMTWEDYSDDELNEWLSKLESGYSELPMYSVNDEEG